MTKIANLAPGYHPVAHRMGYPGYRRVLRPRPRRAAGHALCPTLFHQPSGRVCRNRHVRHRPGGLAAAAVGHRRPVRRAGPLAAGGRAAGARRANRSRPNARTCWSNSNRALQPQQGYYLRRLRAAIEYVRRRGSPDGLDDQLKYLADVDASRCARRAGPVPRDRLGDPHHGLPGHGHRHHHGAERHRQECDGAVDVARLGGVGIEVRHDHAGLGDVDRVDVRPLLRRSQGECVVGRGGPAGRGRPDRAASRSFPPAPTAS